MLETPHVIVAAAIAAKIGNPLISLPLALGSHFILEKIPHWNPHLNSEKKLFGKITSQTFQFVFADSFLALVSGTAIALIYYPDYKKMGLILLACFLGAVPDIIEAPYYFLKKDSGFIKKIWIPFKKSIQVDAEPLWGMIFQLLICFTALWWIFFT